MKQISEHLRKLRFQRRGQITLFIILGLVIVLGALTVFIINYNKPAAPVIGGETVISLQKETVDEYIQGCIEKTIMPAIKLMSEQGGTLYPEKVRRYKHINYRYMLMSLYSDTVCGKTVSRASMQQELNEYLTDHLLECVQFSNFELEGFDVNYGEHVVTTSVATDEVAVQVAFPITIQKGDFRIDFTGFKQSIRLPLGRLFDLALYIMKNETARFYYDKDEFMTEHGEDIKIFKQKPYPDTMYTLAKRADNYALDLTFNFAIKGQDVIANPGDTYIADWHKCYAGEPVTIFSDSLCDGKPCQDCDGRVNGERWCEYDAAAGNGKDLVGNRHYQYSCINGHIYIEPCTDYRLELCAQERDEKYTARCRPNRWQDCVMQMNQANCENINNRDCYWADYMLVELYTNKSDGSRWPVRRPVDIDLTKLQQVPREDPAVTIDRSRCVPNVPPGLKFWEVSADLSGSIVNYCQNSNQLTFFYQPTFSNMSSINVPRYWLDATAANCFMIGDCGNYNNWLSELSMGSFISTHGQLHDQNESLWYSLYQDAPTTVFTKTDVDQYHGAVTYDPLGADTIQIATDYYQQVAAGWGPCDAFDCECKHLAKVADVPCEGSCGIAGAHCPKMPLPNHYKQWALGVAVCFPWQAPGAGSCSACEGSRVCSEYKCRAIGQNCHFYEDDNGVPHCVSDPASAAPQIIFDHRFVDAAHRVTANPNPFPPDAMTLSATDRTGWDIRPGYKPKSIVSLKFNTSIPAKCKIAILPTKEFRANNDAMVLLGREIKTSMNHSFEFNIAADLTFHLEYIENFLDTGSPIGVADIFNDGVKIPLRWLISYLKTNHMMYVFADCYDMTETKSDKKFFTIPIDYTDNKAPIVNQISPADDYKSTKGTEVLFRYDITDDSWLEPPRNICYLYEGKREYSYTNKHERIPSGWVHTNYTDVDAGHHFELNWTVSGGDVIYKVLYNKSALVDTAEIIYGPYGAAVNVHFKIADWTSPDWGKKKYRMIYLNATDQFSTKDYLYNTVLDVGDYDWLIKCSDGLNSTFTGNRTLKVRQY
ncbi:MAG: hypothetical protein KJ601_04045 [Nanoarchaeota archaeon]|nr:hypothetical protein [Nanoarchaeota archaeon]